MKEFYTSFEIDLCDLWRFEKENLERSTSLNDDQIRQFIEKSTELRIQSMKPFLKYNENDEYWKQKRAEYNHFIKSPSPLASDLVFDGRNFYSNLDPLQISIKNTEDFDYWFVLKLRHFDRSLKNLPEFLNSQLKLSFRSDHKRYYEFLTFTMLQYGDEYLTKKLILVVDAYQTKLGTKKEEKFKREKNKRTMDSDKNSFELDDSNEKLFRLIHDNSFWARFSIKLKEENFIAHKTTPDILKNIFFNQKINKSNRVIWKSSNIELKRFIDFFLTEKRLILDLGKDHWFIATQLFVKEDGSDFSISNIRDARSTIDISDSEIYKLLDKQFAPAYETPSSEI